jgi:hypothetical protein
MTALRTGGRLIVALAVLTTACSSRAPAEPAGEPLVRGAVESVGPHPESPVFLVRGGPGSLEPCGISARTDRRTRFLHRDSGVGLREIAPSAIEVGDTVEIHVSGPVAESCPVQGYAAAVVRVVPSPSPGP